MKSIYLKKIFFLNENLIYPKCPICGLETSPYSITSQELNKINLTTLQKLINQKTLILNRIANNVHVLFLCKKCLKGFIIDKKS